MSRLIPRFVRLAGVTALLGAWSFLAPTAKAADASDPPEDFKILGWVENIYLRDPDIKIKAKLDTGAETSSLSAIIVKKFRKDGKRWVRFQVENPRNGELVTLVRERKRTIGIVRHSGENQVRPTVKMKYCLSGVEREAEFSLIDRSEFIYPALLGRNALEHFALIDAGETFLAEKGCVRKKKKAEPTS
jgi:hypothetical protein